MGFPIRPSIGIPCFGFDAQPVFQGASALLQEGTVLLISSAKGEFVD